MDLVDEDLSRSALETLLPREGFAATHYRLYGGHGIGECYVLDHSPRGWEVYYAVRNERHNHQLFDHEGAACAYFLNLLRSDPVIRQRR